jgi:hypothetical protein
MCKNFIFVFKCRRCGNWDKDRSLVLPGRQFPSSPTSILAPDPLSQDDRQGACVVRTADTKAVVATHPAAAALQRDRNTAGFACMQAAHAYMGRLCSNGNKDEGYGKEKQRPSGIKRKREMMSRDDDDSSSNSNGHRSGCGKDEKEDNTILKDEDTEDDIDKDTDTNDDESWHARQRCPDYAMSHNVVTFLDRYCSPRCEQAYRLHRPLEPSPLRTMELAPAREFERRSSSSSQELRVAAEEEEQGCGLTALWTRREKRKMERELALVLKQQKAKNSNKNKKQRGQHACTRKALLVEAVPGLRESVLWTEQDVGTVDSSAGWRHERSLSSSSSSSSLDRLEDGAEDAVRGRGGEAAHENSEPPRKRRMRTPLPGL